MAMTTDLGRAAYLAIGLLGTSRPFSALHRSLYRRFGGRGLLHRGLGCDAVLLTTTGRHTGRPRTVPLFAFPVDGSSPGEAGRTYVVVGSNAGRSRPPAWLRNLEADPDARVQLVDRRWAVRARPATGDEDGALWARVLEAYPGYEVYRRRTSRAIPLIVLEPRGTDA